MLFKKEKLKDGIKFIRVKSFRDCYETCVYFSSNDHFCGARGDVKRSCMNIKIGRKFTYIPDQELYK